VFSPIAADHIASPRNAGEMAEATHYGLCGIPGEGPYVQIWLKIEGGRILKATQQTNGCPAQIASASFTAQIISGRTIQQALKLEPGDLLLALGGLPEGKEHCPEMVVKALRNALGEA
jgi:nitrogen fixation protein NifU and related proteins